MLQMRENPQDGCPAGTEIPDGNAVLRAKKIMIHAVNEAMAPMLELLGCGGCDKLRTLANTAVTPRISKQP